MSGKVFITPNWIGKRDTGQGGIKRCVEAQIKHLPSFGWQFVGHPSDADVVVTHGGEPFEPYKDVPIVNVNHGMLWSRHPWSDGYKDINGVLVKAMSQAVAHTAPSEWVAVALRRGGLFYPEVVYHGIDADEWSVIDSDGYVLWNKARHDLVSNAQEVVEMAKRMQKVPFVSTFGPANMPNLKLTGRVPFEEMKKIIMRAGVYLCTARETFGIGTLEALACGVPIAGWNWGGQQEIVIQGETGYLARPGDYEDLRRCILKCLEDRPRLSANARADVEARWGWEPRIKQYADIFDRVLTWKQAQKYKVSVIVNAYNMEKCLVDALQSIQKQTFKDFECIVVDDCSTDDTNQIAQKFAENDRRFRVVKPEHNLGLSLARNFGFSFAKGSYIRYHDGDDTLDPHALSLEAEALDKDRTIHIAYGHLKNMLEDGTVPDSGQYDNWPPKRFVWRAQMAHLNQLPSTVMMRREVLERSGGYRERHFRNEDAYFWCRVTSLGFKAQKVTDRTLTFHRVREDSKGMVEWKTQGGEPDFTSEFPWRMGAAEARAGSELMKKYGTEGHPRILSVPFAAQGKAPKSERFWHCHDYSYPLVSVMIPVGPKHKDLVIDAVESVLAQSYPDWELVVVNATGEKWENPYDFGGPLAGAPYARLVEPDPIKVLNPSQARNLAYRHTRAPFLAWKDADDRWMPDYLYKVMGMAETHKGVIFTDLLQDKRTGELEPYTYQEFQCGQVVKKMGFAGTSILIPRWAHEAVVKAQGGWDEEIVGWEDWDYQIALQVHAQACAYHLAEPLFIYRYYEGTQREKDFEQREDVVEYINQKWYEYRTGAKQIMCGCAKKVIPNIPPKSLYSSNGNFTQEVVAKLEAVQPNGMVTLRYLGEHESAITMKGKATNRNYKVANQGPHSTIKCHIEDAKLFLAMTSNRKKLFELVE